MKYVLKYKDKDVATFRLVVHDYSFRVHRVQVLDKGLLPLPIKDHPNLDNGLSEFLQSRCIPYDRRYIGVMLKSLGLDKKKGGLQLFLGIMTGFASGFDSYFITPMLDEPKEEWDTPLGDTLYIPREYKADRSDTQDWKEVLCAKTAVDVIDPDYSSTCSLTTDSILPSWWENDSLKQLVHTDEVEKYRKASEKVGALPYVCNTYKADSCVLSTQIPREDTYFVRAFERTDRRLKEVCTLMMECGIGAFQVGYCPEKDGLVVIF